MGEYLFTFGGVLAGAQRWSIGIRAIDEVSGTAPSAAQLSAACDQLFTDFNTSMWNPGTGTGFGSIAGSAANFDQVRGYWRALRNGPASIVGASTQGASPGSGSPNLPPQCAIVVTLLTGLAGKSFKGRVYMPNRTAIVAADGNLPTATVTALAVTASNWLSLFRTRSVGGERLTGVVSGAQGPNAITAVAVDSVVDTQRRRRDKVVAAARPVRPLVVG